MHAAGVLEGQDAFHPQIPLDALGSQTALSPNDGIAQGALRTVVGGLLRRVRTGTAINAPASSFRSWQWSF